MPRKSKLVILEGGRGSRDTTCPASPLKKSNQFSGTARAARFSRGKHTWTGRLALCPDVLNGLSVNDLLVPVKHDSVLVTEAECQRRLPIVASIRLDLQESSRTFFLSVGLFDETVRVG